MYLLKFSLFLKYQPVFAIPSSSSLFSLKYPDNFGNNSPIKINSKLHFKITSSLPGNFIHEINEVRLQEHLQVHL